MSDTDKFDLEFTGVYVLGPGSASLSTEVAELAEKAIDHTYVYFYHGGKWYILKQWPNAVVSMVHLPSDPIQLFFLCANGKVYSRIKGSITEEIIDPSSEGPSDLLLMRRVIAVGDQLVAVGMARRAYKRSPSGAWSSIDDSCFVRRADRTAAVGFNDVISFEGGLIAAGYKGEIWRYDGSVWSMESSPTNVTLNCMASLGDGQVVIAGMGGVIVQGRPGAWQVIMQKVTKGDFWSAVGFQGKIYLSSKDGVYELGGNQLGRITLDSNNAAATTYLSAARDAIWSVGGHDVYSSPDGTNWAKEPNP